MKKKTKTKTTKIVVGDVKADKKMLKDFQELLDGKDLTPAKKKAMGMLIEMIMDTQKDLIAHFMVFLEKEKIEKKFKSYCKKNPVKLQLGGIDINPDECDCTECVGDDDGNKEKIEVQKADLSYMG